jgi:hypothetical protein
MLKTPVLKSFYHKVYPQIKLKSFKYLVYKMSYRRPY